jgi:hypothetical protein
MTYALRNTVFTPSLLVSSHYKQAMPSQPHEQVNEDSGHTYLTMFNLPLTRFQVLRVPERPEL